MKLFTVGIKHTTLGFRRMGDAAQQGYLRANRYEMEKVATKSKRQVPVDYGFLKNSFFMDVVLRRDGISIKLSYRQTYAAFVHENMTARHTRGSKAKFLTDPLSDAMNGYDQRVALAVVKDIRQAEWSSAPPRRVSSEGVKGTIASPAEVARSRSQGRANKRKAAMAKIIGRRK